MSSSLYERLGRQEGISAITRDIIDAHMRNPLVKVRFHDSDLEKLHGLVVDFFCAGSGGPQKYTGMDMLAAHRGMNISEQEFIGVVDDVMAVLEKHRIDRDTKNEVLGIFYSLKNDVVRV